MVQSADITLSNQSGANYRTEHNSINQAFMSCHKGNAEPSYIITGGMWLDDTSSDWLYKFYDGAASFAWVRFHPSTNNVTFVNLKDGVARTESPSLGQLQDGVTKVVGSIGGTANAITGTMSPTLPALVTGLVVQFPPGSANTTAVTLAIDGQAAKALQIGGIALVGGELSGAAFGFYDGTQFQLLGTYNKHPFKGIRFPDQTELTIASGAVTVTGTSHTIDTQSDAAIDDLDTINGGSDGFVIILTCEHTDRTVVLTNAGNIVTPDGSRIIMDSTSVSVVLQYITAISKWIVLSSHQPSADKVNAMGNLGGGSKTIDLDLGRSVSATVNTSATTFTFSNFKPTGVEDFFTLRLTNGGSQTVNWPASVDWAGGSAPTLTASGVDELIFKTIDGGTTVVGAAMLDVK